jgi:outer membrane protein OmpA-like peptidoglycan-associated protein
MRRALIALAVLTLAWTTAGARIGPPVIYFNVGDARIDDRDPRQGGLVWLVQIWRSGANPQIFLSGHADRLGSEAANLALSRRRVEAVRDYLVAHGVPRERIVIAWYGETQPNVETADGVAEPMNRVVLATPEGWFGPLPSELSPAAGPIRP